jgi:hypothetical protein
MKRRRSSHPWGRTLALVLTVSTDSVAVVLIASHHLFPALASAALASLSWFAAQRFDAGHRPTARREKS